jgi:hypothetical protein
MEDVADATDAAGKGLDDVAITPNAIPSAPSTNCAANPIAMNGYRSVRSNPNTFISSSRKIAKIKHGNTKMSGKSRAFERLEIRPKAKQV